MVKGQGDGGVGLGDIGWGSAATARPDSRTDEDSRLSAAAIWPPPDWLHGHQQ